MHPTCPVASVAAMMIIDHNHHHQYESDDYGLTAIYDDDGCDSDDHIHDDI